MPGLRIPLATYRIQFHLGFRFVDGRDLVPYLNELGITDLYSSPRFKARRGSPHAYDVANPLKINSELGTEDEFQELARKLQAYGMGLLLDIVPNHMAASPENPWWMDVLENGRLSIYAHHFAIDWDRPTMKATSTGKLVMPILGEPYGGVLESGQFSIKLDENGFFLRYYDHRLPLSPPTYGLIFAHCRGLDFPGVADLRQGFDALPATADRHPKKEELKDRLWRLYSSNAEFKAALDECLIGVNGKPGDPPSFDLLDRILSRQAWRVAWWRVAREELNYRRFFDINDLIGVRVEDAEVFDSRHPEILGLVENGYATGFRVDHIDGLRDPLGYLHRLRSKALGRSQGNGNCSGLYVIVEKILGGGEELPRSWEACGTTGYDFLNELNNVFVDPEGLKELDRVYREFTGLEQDLFEVRYRRKKQAIEELFAGEVHALGFHLGRLASQDRFARDLPYKELEDALVEVTAWLPVYRTYIRDFEVPERGRRYIEQALEGAAATTAGFEPGVLEFLRRVLLLEIPHYIENRGEWLEFVLSWQQFTGPVMAKGYEDTACYVYNRLVSANEVGSTPETACDPRNGGGLHEANQLRLAHWPHTLNATSTHDTKRSEDVRARINVLSELPEAWGRRLSRWANWNGGHKQMVDGAPAPSRNDEILLYQTLLGAWPPAEEEAGFRDRMRNYMQKAVREAKTHSNWLRPNEAYENAVLSFLDAILEPSESNRFLKDLKLFEERIALAGAINSLAQVVLKIASPGLPDFYQGTELWDFSLVDPDNRRPVDFARRIALLEEIRRGETQDLRGLLRDLTTHWQDGRIKLYLTYKALNFRKAEPDLFQRGAYLPLEAQGSCSFARARNGDWAIASVPRLTAALAGARKRLLPAKLLGDATLMLPPNAPDRWRNVLTGEELEGRSLRLADLWASFPAALLSGRTK